MPIGTKHNKVHTNEHTEPNPASDDVIGPAWFRFRLGRFSSARRQLALTFEQHDPERHGQVEALGLAR